MIAFIAGELVHFAKNAIERLLSDPVESYKEDSFLGLKWRWASFGWPGWRGTIRAYCPDCDTALQVREFFPAYAGAGGRITEWNCVTCDCVIKQIDKNCDQVIESVALQIDRKIRTQEWRGESSAILLGGGLTKSDSDAEIIVSHP